MKQRWQVVVQGEGRGLGLELFKPHSHPLRGSSLSVEWEPAHWNTGAPTRRRMRRRNVATLESHSLVGCCRGQEEDTVGG